MKKMVCEICESQKIKKENGVFVCQDCGTEYSLEEAKKLLIEIEEHEEGKNKKRDIDNSNVINKDKNTLLCQLEMWLTYIRSLEECCCYFNVSMLDSSFYMNPIDISKTKILDKFILEDIDNTVYNELRNAFLNKYIETDYEKKGKIFTELQNISSLFKHNYMSNISYGENIIVDNLPVWGDFISLDDYKKNLTRYLIRYSSNLPVKETIFSVDLYNRTIFGKKIYSISSSTMNRKVIEYKNLINKCWNKYYQEFIISNLQKIIEIERNLLLENKELEEILFLPYKYRESSKILALMQIIIDGKAVVWSDVMNIYETESFYMDVRNKLDYIIDSVSTVVAELYKTNAYLHELSCVMKKINQKIDNISGTLSSINENLNNIDSKTFAILWNTI